MHYNIYSDTAWETLEQKKRENLVPRPDFEFAKAAMKYLTEEEHNQFMELCLKVTERWYEEQKKNDGESYSG